MRLIFSFIAILIVAAAILFVAKQQLSATKDLALKTSPAGPTITVPGVGQDGKTLSAPEASRQIQRNVANEVGASLQKGAARSASAAE